MLSFLKFVYWVGAALSAIGLFGVIVAALQKWNDLYPGFHTKKRGTPIGTILKVIAIVWLPVVHYVTAYVVLFHADDIIDAAIEQVETEFSVELREQGFL